jgi:hypothetical protein
MSFLRLQEGNGCVKGYRACQTHVSYEKMMTPAYGFLDWLPGAGISRQLSYL